MNTNQQLLFNKIERARLLGRSMSFEIDEHTFEVSVKQSTSTNYHGLTHSIASIMADGNKVTRKQAFAILEN